MHHPRTFITAGTQTTNADKLELRKTDSPKKHVVATVIRPTEVIGRPMEGGEETRPTSPAQGQTFDDTENAPTNSTLYARRHPPKLSPYYLLFGSKTLTYRPGNF